MNGLRRLFSSAPSVTGKNGALPAQKGNRAYFQTKMLFSVPSIEVRKRKRTLGQILTLPVQHFPNRLLGILIRCVFPVVVVLTDVNCPF